jgi:hypothetical protein
MLYHSFPGRPDAKQPGKDIQVLESILKHGFLLVPGIAPYPGKADKNGKVTGGDIKLIQCHFCLTAIDDRNLLKKHAETYGDLHLEFDNKNMYEIGAIPVMYVPIAPYTVEANPTSLRHLAATFIHRLRDLQMIAAMLEYLDEAAANFAGEKKITVESDTGVKKAINPIQLRDMLEIILDGIVNVNDSKERKKKEFAQIQGAVQSLYSLFFFADDLPEKIKEKEEKKEDYPYLKSFKEREWRIVQGMSIKGEKQDRELTLEEEKTIMATDPVFFSGQLDIDGRKPRIIDLCRILSAINGKPVQSFINRIYVPNERHKEALVVTENNNFPADKIVSYDREEGIPNDQEGAYT